MKDELVILNQKIDAVTELFYQQKEAQAYQGMAFLVDSMDKALQNILLYKSEHPEAEIDQVKIVSSLMEAMKAMEEKDTVLLADILNYELKETFTSIVEKL